MGSGSVGLHLKSTLAGYYLKEMGNPGKGSASRVSEAPDVKTSEDRLATTCWVPPHSASISNIPFQP